MTNKKFLLNLLGTALLAGVVAVFSCNDKDKLTPADDGITLAGELCDCFTKATDDAGRLNCITNIESKANKWKGVDREVFDAAFDEAIEKCSSSPYDWYYVHNLATPAIADFCTFFTNNPAAADPTVGMQMMMTEGGLYGKWSQQFYNEKFTEAVLTTLLETCPAVPDWYYCSFGMSEFCEEGDDPAGEGVKAAGEFCVFFTNNPAAADETVGMGMLMGEFGAYFTSFSNPLFLAAFLSTLQENCTTVPDWFYCMLGLTDYCGEDEDDPAELGKKAAGEFCVFFTNNPAAADETVGMGMLMGEFMAYFGSFSNPEFLEALLSELQTSCTTVPDWFYCMLGLTDYCPSGELTEEQLKEIGKQSAIDLCDCFVKADGEYITEFYNCMLGLMPVFSQYMTSMTFLMAHNSEWNKCGNVPSWYNAYWSGWQPQGQDPDGRGTDAAAELCGCFSTAVDEAAKLQCALEFDEKYKNDVKNQGFLNNFSAALAECDYLPESWGGKEIDLEELGVKAAAELCGYFSATTDNEQAQQTFVMGFMMTKYGSVMTNNVFTGAFSEALEPCYGVIQEKAPWFFAMFGSGGE